ncbi:MAG: acyltransferase [bacterium]
MPFLQKLKFIYRLMNDPEVDRIFRELKEGRLWLADDASLGWWQEEAAFLHAHSLARACENGMQVGKNPRVEPCVVFTGHRHIKIGDDFVCSFGATIRAVDSAISIGDKVSIGPLACIIGANHGIARDAAIQDQPHESEEVLIGDDVWIGAGAVVLPGARLETGSVVAAGSVVSGEVSSMSVVAGVPAQKVRERK